MPSWEEKFLKTWLAWPQFDVRDHQYCPILDQSNVAQPMDFLEKSELLPYINDGGKKTEDHGFIQDWFFSKGAQVTPPAAFELQCWTMSVKRK